MLRARRRYRQNMEVDRRARRVSVAETSDTCAHMSMMSCTSTTALYVTHSSFVTLSCHTDAMRPNVTLSFILSLGRFVCCGFRDIDRGEVVQ